jgi:hypothetical protein
MSDERETLHSSIDATDGNEVIFEMKAWSFDLMLDNSFAFSVLCSVDSSEIVR